MTGPRWPSVETYIQDKIKIDENGCWIWQGSTLNGYGIAGFPDRKQSTAHRLSYKAHKGDIPDGVLVLHRCDVRNCVNPEHLFLGTHADNIHDCINKNRTNYGPTKTHVAIIEEKIAMKPVWSQERKAGLTYKKIAEKYGVPLSRVYGALSRET